MRGLVQWYLGRLKSHPLSTNVTSAVFLMVAGDVGAQEIETHFLGASHKLDADLQMDRLSYRRYGTMSPNPNLRVAREQIQRRRRTEYQEEHQLLQQDVPSPTDPSTWTTTLESALSTLQSDFQSLDFFRSSTMAFWSGFLATPSFIALYRVFDRLLPASTPLTVAARVGITFIMSVPVNAIFFCYGTLVHHVTEWAALIAEWRHEVPDASLRQVLRQVPFDWPMFWGTARLKVETELARTVLVSASVWIPVKIGRAHV